MSRIFAYVQYILPHHAISRVIFWLTRIQSPYAQPFMRWFERTYSLNMSEAAEPNLKKYASFNAFFTRALKEGARPISSDEKAVVSPCDGHISQIGPIVNGRIIQAKGHDYTAAELLGSEADAIEFEGGQFVTIYLSPADYHRVHMPVKARLRSTLHVPGRLFSVSPGTVENVPRLFARNERAVCFFDTEKGPVAQVLVGAINVAAIETVWAGLITPPTTWGPRQVTHQGKIVLERGEEMGRFNMGSTVVLLIPPGAEFFSELSAGDEVKMGQSIGDW